MTTTHISRVPRVVFLTALISGLIAGGLLGGLSNGIGNAHAETMPGPAPAGSFELTMVLNPDDNLLEAFLVDTRTGAVYRGDYDGAEKEVIWRKYVTARFH